MKRGDSDDAIDPIAHITNEARLVRGVARRILFDPNLVDDAVQQTWIAMLEHPPQDERRVSGWLATVAKNCALKLLRGRRRSDARERALPPVPPESSPLEAIEREATFKAVTHALLELPEPYKRTLLMRYFDNLPPRIIAKKEGVSVEAIRSRLQRGAAMMRGRLAREFHESQETKAKDRHDDGRSFCASLFLLAAPPDLEWAGEFLRAKLAGAVSRLQTLRTKLILTALGIVSAATLIGVATQLGSVAAISETPEPSLPSTRALPPPLPRIPVALRPSTGNRHRLPDEPANYVEGAPALRVKVIRDRDGNAAPGVRVDALCFARPNAQLAPLDAITDEQGIAWLLDVTPGPAAVRALGGSQALEIDADEPSSVTLHVPAGICLDGNVVDELGHAIRDATIELATDESNERYAPSTVSDGAGHFALVDVVPGCRVFARHPDFEPSFAEPVLGRKGETASTRLVLRKGGARLLGRVEDYAGQPTRARLRIESVSKADESSGLERFSSRPPSLEIETNADGSFDWRGLPAGRVEILARSESSPPTIVQRTLDAVIPTDLRIVVRNGVRVSGTVLEADGRPAAFAFVRSIGASGLGENATDQAFSSSLVLTDRNGRFLLPGLPGRPPDAGGLSLFIESGSGGRAQPQVPASQMKDGAVIEIDPVLEPGAALCGHVLDRDGSPIPGLFVEATHALGGATFRGPVRTDTAGRFTLTNLPRGECVLRVRGIAAERNEPAETLVAMTTRASAESDIEVRLPRDANARGAIRGRITNSAALSRERGNAVVTIRDAYGWLVRADLPTDAAGAFVTPLLLEGDYRLVASANDGRQSPIADVAVRNFGATATLELPRPATLRVDAAAVAQTSGVGEGLLLVLDDQGNVLARETVSASQGERALDLAPGAVAVYFLCEGRRIAEDHVTLAPGETRTLRLVPK